MGDAEVNVARKEGEFHALDSQTDENFASALLTEWGFRTTRFEKSEMQSGIKTPEFRVYDGDHLVFFCEVKSFTDPSNFYERLSAAPPGTLIEEHKSGTPKGNRLITQMRHAVKQFRDVNPEHQTANMVIIVNHDEMFLPQDVAEMVQGYAQTDSGDRFHTLGRAARRRFVPDSDVIDLYIIITRIHPTGEKQELAFFLKNSAERFPQIDQLLNRFQKWRGQPSA